MTKVKVDRQCRICKKVPKDGYYKSRVVRNDFICPKCSNQAAKENRERKIEYLEGQGHD